MNILVFFVVVLLLCWQRIHVGAERPGITFATVPRSVRGGPWRSKLLGGGDALVPHVRVPAPAQTPCLSTVALTRAAVELTKTSLRHRSVPGSPPAWCWSSTPLASSIHSES